MIENKNTKMGRNICNPFSEAELQGDKAMDTNLSPAIETKTGWAWSDAMFPQIPEDSGVNEKYIKERSPKRATN